MLILSNLTNFDSTKRKIALQTSIGRDIDNWQIHEIQNCEIKSNNDFSQYIGTTFKGGITAIYNCHGFTFASRRTNLGPEVIRDILTDDKYVEVDLAQAMVGDVVLYISGDNKGDIEHTGVISWIDTVSNPKAIWVHSKWGKFKEATHVLYNCPYNDCTIQIWRNNHGFNSPK